MNLPRARCLAPDLLAGKAVWITGGGTGLGRAMALRFAGLGAKIGLSAHDLLDLSPEEWESLRGQAKR